MTLGAHPSMSLAAAREAWRAARLDVEHGRDPAGLRKRAKAATDFKGVAEEWLHRDQAGNKSKREVERIVNRELNPAWGHRAIADITRRECSISSTASPIAARPSWRAGCWPTFIASSGGPLAGGS